jgi:uncharacterized membrane protein HdeD (DUF308 family)
MNELPRRYGRALALRGLIAFLFGVLALIMPGLTMLWLIALFAAFALFSGTASVVSALQSRKNDEDWGLLLALGLVGIGAGVLTIMHPALSGLILLLLIGANALITGVLDIALAIRWRKTIQDKGLLIASGAASLVFGTIIFLFPDAGALAMVWLISFYAMVTGVLLLALAFKLHNKTAAEGATQVNRRVGPDRRVASGHT